MYLSFKTNNCFIDNCLRYLEQCVLHRDFPGHLSLTNDVVTIFYIYHFHFKLDTFYFKLNTFYFKPGTFYFRPDSFYFKHYEIFLI